MLRISYRNMLLLLAAALVVGGCASTRNAGGAQVAVTPAPYIVMPDSAGNVAVDVALEIPDHYFGRRSRLLIMPAIVKDTVIVAEMDSVAVDAPIYAKKLYRKEVLEDYEDTFTGQKRALRKMSDTVLVHCNDSVSLGEYADGSRIVAFVSADGCGRCRAVDTLDLGGISDPGNLISPVFRMMEPEMLPQVKEGRGEAELQFVINRHDINLSLGRNKEEMERMFEALYPIVADSLARIEVSFYGMASADGPLGFNTRLAESRARAAKDWLISEIPGLADTSRVTLTTGSRPEGWAPVLRAMTGAGAKDSASVKEIISRYADDNDDVQERFIRRLPCWRLIRDNFLQKDRKVTYVYRYSTRRFASDAEMLDMYAASPESLNENELLRVSLLIEEPSEKTDVYRTVLEYYPQSQVAINNLSVMLASAGETSQAMSVLEDGMGTEAAEYNMGLLKAVAKDYISAYRLLLPFADINTAIVAICVGEYGEAARIMDTVEDLSPLAEYVRALIAVHDADADAFFTHLEAAVSDASLKDRAETDAMLDAFRNDARFDVIME